MMARTTRMTTELALLLALSSLWGASYTFIKIGVETIPPVTLIAARTLIAGTILVATLRLRGLKLPASKGIWARFLVQACLNSVVPFTLIAWGETRIDSGVAAIGNASMPLFVALLALRFVRSERATGFRLFGLLLGLVGVGVLVGVNPQGGWSGVVGTLAVILASLSYAAGSLYTQTLLTDVRNDVLVAASIAWGAIWLTPFGVLQAPTSFPGWAPIAAVLALALLGTVAGQLLYFRLIYRYGSSRASLVVYLLPVTALFYGALLLGEPISASAILGLVLILTGTPIASGVLRFPRRRAAVVTAP